MVYKLDVDVNAICNFFVENFFILYNLEAQIFMFKFSDFKVHFFNYLNFGYGHGLYKIVLALNVIYNLVIAAFLSENV